MHLNLNQIQLNLWTYTDFSNIRSKKGKFVVRSIIAKVLTTFDKDLIFKNIFKQKKYYENRGSEISLIACLNFSTNKRSTLCLSLKKLRAEEKKLYDGVFMMDNIAYTLVANVFCPLIAFRQG